MNNRKTLKRAVNLLNEYKKETSKPKYRIAYLIQNNWWFVRMADRIKLFDNIWFKCFQYTSKVEYLFDLKVKHIIKRDPSAINILEVFPMLDFGAAQKNEES